MDFAPFIWVEEEFTTITGTPAFASVLLTLVGTDRAFNFELQRARGFGSFSTISIIPGNRFNTFRRFAYDDFDVDDRVTYRYRGRHVRSDALPGPFSTPVQAQAAVGPVDDTGTGDTGGGGGGGGGGDGGGEEEIFLIDYTPFRGDTLIL